MEKVDIKVSKSKAESFYIKQLSFDECMSLYEKSGSGDENSRLVQLCLVDEEGKPIFKPQQIPMIKERLSGVDMAVVLTVANGINEFSKIAEVAEKYSKNSKSDQISD